MKKKIVLTRYIDPETGEYQEKRKVIDSVYQENDFVMNYRKKKYTIEQGAFLPADIGCFFVGMFYLLIPYLNNDNMLEIDKRPITHTDIADICRQMAYCNKCQHNGDNIVELLHEHEKCTRHSRSDKQSAQ